MVVELAGAREVDGSGPASEESFKSVLLLSGGDDSIIDPSEAALKRANFSA